jgi:hypothetical protein
MDWRRGLIAWPPRSPDISPPFLFVGKSFAINVGDCDDIINRIEVAAAGIRTLSRLVTSRALFKWRCETYVQKERGHRTSVLMYIQRAINSLSYENNVLERM